MFQTEPILWLQASGSPFVTGLLSLVTLLGYTPVYIVLLLTLAFAFRLRQSLAVLTAVLVAAVLFEGLKLSAALPRPDDVDDRVKPGAERPSLAVVERGGARSFWSLPPADAVAAVRRHHTASFGFPSGHVAAATAFLLGFARFFRSRRALAFAALWLPLMALSRMYLGRHFLGDVLGGALVGVLATGVAGLLVRALDEAAFSSRSLRPLVPVSMVAFGLLGLTPLLPVLPPHYAGGFVGLVVAYAAILVSGPPSDGGSARQRVARVLLALVVFAAVASGSWAALEGLELARSQAALLLAATFLTTATLAGSVALGRRLGLYGP